MSDPKKPHIPLPYFLISVTVIAIVGATVESGMNLAPGSVTPWMVLIPTLIAGMAGGMEAFFPTAAIAVVGYLISMWAGRPNDPNWPWIPIGVAGAILGVGYAIVAYTSRIKDTLTSEGQKRREIEDKYNQLQQESNQRETEVAKKLAAMARHAEEEKNNEETESAETDENATVSIEYSKLLLQLNEVGKALTSTRELREIYQAILNLVFDVVGARSCSVFLYKGPKVPMERVAIRGEAATKSAMFRVRSDRGMIGWVIKNQEPLALHNIDARPELRDLLDQQEIPSYACAPLVVAGEVVGVINIETAEQKTGEFDRVFSILSEFAGMAISNAQMFAQMKDMARRDPLTGLYNHGTFQQILREAVAVSRPKSPVALMFCDIDNFKEFNDTYGHLSGDAILRGFSEELKKNFKSPHVVARYGGDEFVCLMRGLDPKQAMKLAEKFRHRIALRKFVHEGKRLELRTSIGIAVCPWHGKDKDELIANADSALYEAKDNGRNQAVMYRSEMANGMTGA